MPHVIKKLICQYLGMHSVIWEEEHPGPYGTMLVGHCEICDCRVEKIVDN